MTLAEEIKELQREAGTRERVYPEWVRQGKIKKEVARHRLDCIKSTLARLQEMERQQSGEQTALF